MSADQFPRLKKILAEALDLPPEERAAYLEEVCGDDVELLREAQARIGARRSEDSLDVPDTKTVSVHSFDVKPGVRVGPYELLERIGHGGMGEVWKANQVRPVRRTIALKLIKAGMDSREILARFDSERQALALMNHPSIAKIFDAGRTPGGRPYFAMEYVPGLPITDYCDRRRLNTRERLELFQRTCDAVRHAHQKAILHRDLKPGNILVCDVDGKPLPKIIDFGVAKATTQKLTENSIYTAVGQLIGTPEYMSPEQADLTGEDVDTRTDVYSLGVVLYELLVGALPFDAKELRRAGFEGIARMLREQDPPRPSTKLSTLGNRVAEIVASRRTQLRHLTHELRGDLDWIVMQCLEKDRNRRYGSTHELSQDVQRHLDHEPVLAAPPNPIYRMQRFVRRHRLGVAMAASAIVALAGFSIWQSVQSHRIVRERDTALANERIAHAQKYSQEDPTMAVAHALASLEIMDQPEARVVVREALIRGALYDDLPLQHLLRGNPLSLDASPDGRFLAIAWGGQGPAAAIHDMSNNSTQLLEGPAGSSPTPDTANIRFTSDGARVVAVSRHGGVHVWRCADGAYLMDAFADSVQLRRAVFPTTAPSIVLISESEVGERTRWYRLDVAEGRLQLIGHSRGRFATTMSSHLPAVSSQGDRFVDYEDGTVYLQSLDDLDTDRVQVVGTHASAVLAVAGSKDLRWIASLDADWRVRIWDNRGETPQLFREYQSEPGNAWLRFSSFQPDLLGVFTSSNAIVFDLSNPTPVAPRIFPDRSHWTKDGVFLPDGSLCSARIGIASGHVAWWNHDPVVEWELALGDSLAAAYLPLVSPDGDNLLAWTTRGDLVRVNLGDPDSPTVQVVGRAAPLNTALPFYFAASEDRMRILTGNLGSGARILDVETGASRQFEESGAARLSSALSASGRRACLLDWMDGKGQDGALTIMDLDTLREVASLNPDGIPYFSTAFRSDSVLVALSRDHLASYPITNDAAPDTIWTGDASTGGFVLGNGDALLVRGREFGLSFVDLRSGRATRLGTTPPNTLMSAAWSSTLGLCAVSGWSSQLYVYDVGSGRSWSVPLLYGRGATVEIDPRGRWILASQDSGIYAIRLPLDPLFADIESDDYIQRVQNLTNVRVVPPDTRP